MGDLIEHTQTDDNEVLEELLVKSLTFHLVYCKYVLPKEIIFSFNEILLYQQIFLSDGIKKYNGLRSLLISFLHITFHFHPANVYTYHSDFVIALLMHKFIFVAESDETYARESIILAISKTFQWHRNLLPHFATHCILM
jgi:hypothetical protein